jgi:ATP-binding cassette, subfamily B, bacterial PglK
LIYGITNGVENLIVVRFGSQITLLMEIATVLILGMYFIFKEPQLALVFFLATWAVFGVLEKVINEKSRKLGQLLYHGLTTVSQKLHEGLMMQREFLVWRMDNPKIQEALPLRNQLAHTKAKATMLPNISKHIIEISFAFLVVSLSFLSIRVDNAKSGIESIILLFLVSSRMIPALLRAQNALLSIKNVQGSSEITISLLDEMSKVDEESEDNEYFSKNPSVENITFVYDDSKKATINNVSFKLEKGDVVGVIGKTGSGKSTLINILVGLLEPQSGRVYRFKSSGNLLAKHRIGVSYIPQDSFIFGGTVRENVLCGRKFKDEDVLLALNVAQFGIANIGDGELLEYRLELGGGNLSGGEKQRIAIARGIIGRPGFLVLDEATSALDVHTESKVYSSLLDFLSKDSIIVIITHRIESLKHANRFFDISNGKVLDHRDLSEIAIKMREPRRKIAKRRA